MLCNKRGHRKEEHGEEEEAHGEEEEAHGEEEEAHGEEEELRLAAAGAGPCTVTEAQRSQC